MTETKDVIIVGAGTAGLSALREIRKHTEHFAIINDGPWGTMCARVGCMPSKALIEAANTFHRRKVFEELGIRGAEGLSLDASAVLARVRAMRDDFVHDVLKMTDDLGERAITGRAKLLGPDRVLVNGRELRARKIILATGSRPKVPEAFRALGSRVLTTDTLFELESLPPRMAVIGMGAIGAEMAQALARLGVDVHGFDNDDRIAGLSDPRVNEVAAACLRKDFALHLGSEAEVSPGDRGVRVRAGDTEIEVDAVLAALGRQPNIEDLGLETLGVPLDVRGLPKFEPRTLQIEGTQVFLTGDMNAHRPLLHEANDDGYIAAMNACGSSPRSTERRTPLAITFCDPNVAVIGKRHSQLDGCETCVGEASFERQGRARIGVRNAGLIRIYANCKHGVVVGAELCAPDGEHLAHWLAMAIDRKLCVSELLRMPFYHPVIEEGLRKALRSLWSQLDKHATSDLTECDDTQA